MRLEQWGPYRLARPDPTAVGSPNHPELWASADATYKGEKGKGAWENLNHVPEHWPVEFGGVRMVVRLAPYKHTGVFPEQRTNWDWACSHTGDRTLNILNLFAYTGGATMALATRGHFVTHVDASKPAIAWAKENAALNGLPGDAVRWILEDAPLFVARERKRGKTYDAIILDPPAFGHSPSGKTWRIERDLKPLLEECANILSATPAFIVLNGYAQHDTPDSFHRLLSGILHQKTPHTFTIDAAELTLTAEDGRLLSTGITARCAFGA